MIADARAGAVAKGTRSLASDWLTSAFLSYRPLQFKNWVTSKVRKPG